MGYVGSGKFPTPAGIASGLPDYDFYSGPLTTTDVFTGNTLTFGFIAKEITIINTGAKPIIFQYPRLTGALDGSSNDKVSGYVAAGATLVLRHAVKTGIALRSESAGNPSAGVHVIAN